MDGDFPSLDHALLKALRERKLVLEPAVHLGRSTQGLAFCGFCIRPGEVFASARKLSRYCAGLARVQAALTGAQTRGFRRRLGEGSDAGARPPSVLGCE